MNYQELLESPLIPSQIVPVVRKAAHTPAPVLIQGEHGTEKELIGKIIHFLGNRKDYPFFKIDCRSLTGDPFQDQIGRLLMENHDGAIPTTLYLKEVGDLGPLDQLKLLELMEDGVIRNGIEKRTIKNLRVISSSSVNLKEKVLQGKFLEDLYHRLNLLSIYIPPLRERAEEISSIAQYFLEEHLKKNKINMVKISNQVLTLLKSYWWPGNLRELEQVILRSAIFSEGGDLTEKDLLFETENENRSFMTFLKKAEGRPSESKHSNFLHEQNPHTLSLFLFELVHRIKNPLVSVKTFTQLLREKFNDMEFREHFYRIVSEDIEKIDSLLNGLLGYIKINTPIEKKNTVHSLLEEVLIKHELPLGDKKIKIFKKFEKDLPETIVHDEQLRYIFETLLQYALPSILPNGSIGLLTKSHEETKEAPKDKQGIQGDGRYVEILIVFTGYKKPVEPFESLLGIPPLQEREAIELELKLVKEMIQKNRGTMIIEANDKKPRTLISLKFPIERRKIIYYQTMKS